MKALLSLIGSDTNAIGIFLLSTLRSSKINPLTCQDDLKGMRYRWTNSLSKPRLISICLHYACSLQITGVITTPHLAHPVSFVAFTFYFQVSTATKERYGDVFRKYATSDFALNVKDHRCWQLLPIWNLAARS